MAKKKKRRVIKASDAISNIKKTTGRLKNAAKEMNAAARQLSSLIKKVCEQTELWVNYPDAPAKRKTKARKKSRKK